MIVIDEFAAGRDQAIGADLDAAADIEFATRADENVVTENDRWAGRVDAVVLEEDVVLQHDVFA